MRQCSLVSLSSCLSAVATGRLASQQGSLTFVVKIEGRAEPAECNAAIILV